MLTIKKINELINLRSAGIEGSDVFGKKKIQCKKSLQSICKG